MQGPEPLSHYVFGEVLIQLFWAQVDLEHGITEEALKCEEPQLQIAALVSRSLWSCVLL